MLRHAQIGNFNVGPDEITDVREPGCGRQAEED